MLYVHVVSLVHVVALVCVCLCSSLMEPRQETSGTQQPRRSTQPPASTRSLVWTHFRKVCKGEAVCNLCESPLRTPSGTTTTLVNHLKRHASQYAEFQAAAKVRPANQPSIADVLKKNGTAASETGGFGPEDCEDGCARPATVHYCARPGIPGFIEGGSSRLPATIKNNAVAHVSAEVVRRHQGEGAT
uniref:Putative secreted protein n=1 Tax=Ixodes ricinus TaxID=34613 RepID=A0A147BB39_IXORI